MRDTFDINVDRLPPEIAESTRAVVWMFERRGDKQTKVPYVSHRPSDRPAVDNPTTWGTFTMAVDTVIDGKADGPGIVLGNGLIGADLDECRNPETGAIDADALAIVRQLDSYSEISPSGRGLHVFARGRCRKADAAKATSRCTATAGTSR